MKKGKSIFSRVSFGMVCVAMAALQLLSYLSGYINPAKAWFMTIFGLLFLPLLVGNVVLLVWGLFRRSRTTVIPGVVVLLSLLLLGRFVQFGGGDDPADADVTLVSYNVGRFSAGSGSFRQGAADSIMTDLSTRNADIICLQEFHIPNSLDLKEYVGRFFPGATVDYFVTTSSRGKSGNVTISRFPSVGRGVLDFKNSANLAVYSDYVIGGRTVRVYNCHLESYNISLSRLLTSSSRVSETEQKMERAITRRPEQVVEVLHNIESCSLPTIVAGDFNDNPMSYTYNRLVRGHKDAFRAAGSGFGATYSEFWPMFRIDYALLPEDFCVTSYEVDRRAVLSDHYPVITKFHP